MFYRVQIDRFPLLYYFSILHAMNVYGRDCYRLAIGLDAGKLDLWSAYGFPARHNFIVFRNLILNRNLQIRYDGQGARNCLFINIQSDAVAICQITDETWIRQFIKNV